MSHHHKVDANQQAQQSQQGQESQGSGSSELKQMEQEFAKIMQKVEQSLGQSQGVGG
jgi:hypothetical protein